MKTRLNQLERAAEWNIWLTSSFWMHFAVVSVETRCLPVPYIYRSCVADGDVKKRGDRPRGQVKEMVIARMRWRSGVIDGQGIKRHIAAFFQIHTQPTIDWGHMLKPVCNEHAHTRLTAAFTGGEHSSAHHCLLMGAGCIVSPALHGGLLYAVCERNKYTMHVAVGGE